MRVKGDGWVFCCSIAFFFLPHEVVNYLLIPLRKICTFFSVADTGLVRGDPLGVNFVSLSSLCFLYLCLFLFSRGWAVVRM